MKNYMQNFKNLTDKQKGVLALIALVLIALGAYFLIPKTEPELTMEQRCAIDLESTVIEDKDGTLKTDKEITEALFNHYFSYYKGKTQCPLQDLTDYRLNEVEITKTDDRCVIANLNFDLKPAVMTETGWNTPEAIVENDWIRGKKGTFDITKAIATSTKDITRYQINFQSPCTL